MRATGPCILIVWCFVKHDLSLSHTDVPPPLSPPPPSATVEYTRLRLHTLRIAGRDSNVLLTDMSRWPMIHTRSRLMMVTRNNGSGSMYVTATLLCDVCVRVSPVDV